MNKHLDHTLPDALRVFAETHEKAKRALIAQRAGVPIEKLEDKPNLRSHTAELIKNIADELEETGQWYPAIYPKTVEEFDELELNVPVMLVARPGGSNTLAVKTAAGWEVTGVEPKWSSRQLVSVMKSVPTYAIVLPVPVKPR